MRSARSVTVPVIFVAVSLSFAQVALAQQLEPAQDSAVSLQTIVTRMEQAQQENRNSYRPYTLTREYRFYGGEITPEPKSDVVARITFSPPNTQNYTIEKAEGSSRGEDVVRHILEGESDACSKQTAGGSVDSRNYDFKLLGDNLLNGRPVWVLEAKARHPEKYLINGKVWVDKDTYLVHRMEGDISKSPSWWLKNVHTIFTFGDANGMWLRTSMKAVADVRFFGPHIVTDQAVKIQTADQIADLRVSANRPRASRSALRPLGTIVLQH
jgi:hypothetical protein